MPRSNVLRSFHQNHNNVSRQQRNSNSFATPQTLFTETIPNAFLNGRLEVHIRFVANGVTDANTHASNNNNSNNNNSNSRADARQNISIRAAAAGNSNSNNNNIANAGLIHSENAGLRQQFRRMLAADDDPAAYHNIGGVRVKRKKCSHDPHDKNFCSKCKTRKRATNRWLWRQMYRQL